MNVFKYMMLWCVITASVSSAAQSPGISIHVTRSEAINPLAGVIEYYITADSVSAKTPLVYDVSLKYIPAGESEPVVMTETAQGRSSNRFEMNNLTPDTTISAQLEASVLLPGDTIPSIITATTDLTTPAVPILIGTLPGGTWSANYGIEGTVFDGYPHGECFYYITSFVGEGAFRFISKFGRNETDWATVDKEPIYAPSQDRVNVLNDHWYPYDVFVNTNTGHAWRIPNFMSDDTSLYTVQFNFKDKKVLISHRDVPTEMAPINIDNDEDDIVDVYNMQGIILRKGIKKAQATAGLDRGIYIMGQEKVFVP